MTEQNITFIQKKMQKFAAKKLYGKKYKHLSLAQQVYISKILLEVVTNVTKRAEKEDEIDSLLQMAEKQEEKKMSNVEILKRFSGLMD